MDSTENNNENKKKNRPVPLFFWFAGGALAGGLIIFALLYNKKSGEVNSLSQQLTHTENTLTREKDSLSTRLSDANTRYITLDSDHKALMTKAEEQQARNRRLAASNASYVEREQQYKNDYAALLGSSDLVKAENEKLKSQTVSMQAALEDMQKRMAERDNLNAEQLALIDRQTAEMKSDSADKAALLDSLKRENVSGYFNNTELTAAYGLYHINIPYAHYFFGLNTVNGYVINKHFMTGFGLGIAKYDAGWIVPVYLDFRYNFSPRKLTPYFFADGGVLFEFEEHMEPGLFLNPGAGVYWKLTDHLGVNLGAGLYTTKLERRASFVNGKVGLIYRRK